MRIFLRVKHENGFRDAAILESGRQLVIGRSATADVSFPGDSQMSSAHASLKIVDGTCQIQDLNSTNGTFLNEERVMEGELKPGDVLRCGGTDFVVELPGAAAGSSVSAAAASGAAAPAAAGAAAATQRDAGGKQAAASGNGGGDLPADLKLTKGFVSESAAEIFEQFQLKTVVDVPPEAGETTSQFISRLAKNPESNDCVNFLGYALPKRCGVWWAVQCVTSADSFMAEQDRDVLETATTWVRQPAEAVRRKAMTLAEQLEMATPASWAGVAVFWSHGSMAPEGAPEVKPAPHLAGKAVSAVAALAAVAHTPENAPQRRRQFVDLALQIASGENSWEKSDGS